MASRDSPKGYVGGREVFEEKEGGEIHRYFADFFFQKGDLFGYFQLSCVCLVCTHICTQSTVILRHWIAPKEETGEVLCVDFGTVFLLMSTQSPNAVAGQ